MPSITGTAKRNIMVVPCMVKIWLYYRVRGTCYRARQLHTHQQRFHAAGQQEEEGGHDVAHADGLMGGDREPAEESRGMRARCAPAAPRSRLHPRFRAPASATVVIAGSPDNRAAAACRRDCRRMVAMWLPGLMFCGSVIQPPRLPFVLGSVPAAMVRRLAKMRKVGRNLALRRQCPRIVWQRTQA